MAWKHPEDATLTMPINSLAMEILRDFEASSGWNRDNWIKVSQQRGTVQGRGMERALSEGWAWLISRGLVAWDPSQPSPNAYFITRLGHALCRERQCAEHERDSNTKNQDGFLLERDL